jgi:hypothetical protein
VLFHPKQLMLFSSDDQGEVRVWDLVTKAPAFKTMTKVRDTLLLLLFLLLLLQQLLAAPSYSLLAFMFMGCSISSSLSASLTVIHIAHAESELVPMVIVCSAGVLA